MSSEGIIVNRVASSGLVTVDLEEYHQPGERILIDVKDQLYQGFVLKEKDFREFVKSHDWSQYKERFVAITCTAEAIVPTWAYMLLAVALQPYARLFVFGTLTRLEEKLFERSLSAVNWDDFRGKRVVVKGCSKVDVPVAVYVEVVRQLQPVVVSLMFGVPCSTVPLYKASKSLSASGEA